MPMKIIPTSFSSHIAKKLENKKGLEIIRTTTNRDKKNFFPDGEVYTALSGIKKGEKKCVVIHSGSPHPNRGLMELKIILEILKNLKVQSIELFFAYFPYGMQDDIFDKGEANMAESLIKEFLDYYEVKKIYVIDAHFFKKTWLSKYPVVNISVLNGLVKKAKKDFPDLVLLAPDEGSTKRTGLAGVEKKRINSYDVKIVNKGDLARKARGKVIGVVDDILETGGTLDRFYDECKKYGAKDAVAIITHGVLKKGIKRIQGKYAKLYLTNTIKNGQANVDVSDIIYEIITG